MNTKSQHATSHKNNKLPEKKRINKEVKSIINDEPPIEKVNWEELNDIYMANASGIITISQEVNNITSNEEFMSRVQKKEEMFIILKGFKRDVEELTNDLVGIKALHLNKIGPIENEQDLVDSINIYDNYLSFQNRFNTVVGPIINMLQDAGLEAAIVEIDEKAEIKTIGENNE